MLLMPRHRLAATSSSLIIVGKTLFANSYVTECLYCLGLDRTALYAISVYQTDELMMVVSIYLYVFLHPLCLGITIAKPYSYERKRPVSDNKNQGVSYLSLHKGKNNRQQSSIRLVILDLGGDQIAPPLKNDNQMTEEGFYVRMKEMSLLQTRMKLN